MIARLVKMADDLPTEFDVVILGTGLPESIIAAACTRIGQRVLHVDARNYYGGNWASFTFSGLQTWIEDCKVEGSTEEVGTFEDQVSGNEETILFKQGNQTIQNIEFFSYSSSEDTGDVEEVGALNINPDLLSTDTTLDNCENAPPCQETLLPDISTCQISSEEAEANTPDNTEQNSDPDISSGGDHILDTAPIQESDGTVETEPHTAQTCHQDARKTITYSDIVKEGRRFNIDLVSKFLYSRGLLIELLIKSNVSRYTEFKNVTRILSYHNGKIEQVPCSRADVFASKQLSMVEKRILMKFLMLCADYELHKEDYEEYENSTFSEFLKSKQLTPSLQHFVLHSIAMVSDTTQTTDGLKATQHFLRCLGRYGNTPFLFPMYGLGEIPQCFCRMCAVFGGIYCLHHSLKCLIVDGESKQCKAVIDSRGKRISCTNLVVEDGYLSAQTCASVCYQQISRAILITDRSVMKAESDQEISVLTFPPAEEGQSAVHLTELCSSTMTCMKNTYLVHLTCSSTKTTAREDLEPVVKQLFTVDLDLEKDLEGDSLEKPRALWALYFNMRDSSGVDRQSYFGLPSNVYVCSGPDACFGNDHAVQQAENIFHQMYPTEEFCPPAPNPEDIIYVDEERCETNLVVDSKPETSAESETVMESAEDTDDLERE
ncbi:rab proteins geranylgeranyltransferase component A 1 isoform 2-T2 [Rhinophrynus dorsalis]